MPRNWSDRDSDDEPTRPAKQRTNEALEAFMKTKRNARPLTCGEHLLDGMSSQASDGAAPSESSGGALAALPAQIRAAAQPAPRSTAVEDNRPKPHPPPEAQNAPTQTVKTRSTYLSSVLTPLATEISPIVYPDGGNPVANLDTFRDAMFIDPTSKDAETVLDFSRSMRGEHAASPRHPT